jgi:4-hydroxyphenylpyruvate dioxygenase-like putative hemolysin
VRCHADHRAEVIAYDVVRSGFSQWQVAIIINMRIAMFSWETLHSIAVGGVAAHVTELVAALQRKRASGSRLFTPID